MLTRRLLPQAITQGINMHVNSLFQPFCLFVKIRGINQIWDFNGVMQWWGHAETKEDQMLTPASPRLAQAGSNRHANSMMGSSDWKFLFTRACLHKSFCFSKQTPKKFFSGADLQSLLSREGKVLMMGERENGFVTIHYTHNSSVTPLLNGNNGCASRSARISH